jgi:hypothetical protein
MMAGWSGMMPTTLVLLCGSLLRRSCGLDDHTWRQISRGTGGEGEQVLTGRGEVVIGGGELGFYIYFDLKNPLGGA